MLQVVNRRQSVPLCLVVRRVSDYFCRSLGGYAGSCIEREQNTSRSPSLRTQKVA